MKKNALILLITITVGFVFLSGCLSDESETTTTPTIPTSTPTPSPTDTPDLPENELLNIHFIDVGQGDSILLQYGNDTMLIDAGERQWGDDVIAYIQTQGIEDLDYVVATHPHADHIGGLITVLNSVPVEQFIDSGSNYTSATYRDVMTLVDDNTIPHITVEKGDQIEFNPEIEMWVLNPPETLYGDPNEDSVVLKVVYSNVSFLLTGDAGFEAEDSILLSSYPDSPDSDILKVGHHGSESASNEVFLQIVTPEICIISVGEGNTYNHPNPDALSRLQDCGCMIYRTDEDGTIVISTDGEEYQIGEN
jgi:competence protein ComEC